MIDLLYILGTVMFFLAMLAYARVCERLAGDDTHEGDRS